MKRVTFATRSAQPQTVLVEKTAKVYKKHSAIAALLVVASLVCVLVSLTTRAVLLGPVGMLGFVGSLAYFVLIRAFKWWDHD